MKGKIETAGRRQMQDRGEGQDAVEAIRQGIADADAGRVKPAREALQALREKLGFSPAPFEP